jgi:CS domain
MWPICCAAVRLQGVKESDAIVDLTPHRLRVSVERINEDESAGSASTTVLFALFDRLLFDEVVPEECKIKFLPSKVSTDTNCQSLTMLRLHFCVYTWIHFAVK